MAQNRRAGDMGQFLWFAAKSHDFLKILRNRPRIRGVEYFAHPHHLDHEAVFEIRRGISRFPEDPTRATTGPGAEYVANPPHFGTHLPEYHRMGQRHGPALQTSQNRPKILGGRPPVRWVGLPCARPK